MDEDKEFTYVTEAKLVAYIDTYPNRPDLEGKFYLSGKVVIPAPKHRDRFKPGDPINTSVLVNVDITKGWFESENTIYVVIAKANEEVYKMTNPS